MRTSRLLRLVWAANALLVMGLAAACYGSYRLLAEEGLEVPRASAWKDDVGAGALPGERALGDYAVIWQLDSLLGDAPSVESTDTAKVEGDIRCLGTTVARSGSGEEVTEYSYALLVDPKGERQMVRRGEAFGGWTVARVERDGVLLRREGEERLLQVEEKGVEKSVGTLGSGTRPTKLPTTGRSTVDFSPYVKPTSDVTREVRRALYSLVTRNEGLLAQVARSAFLAPHSSSGEPDGVKIDQIQEDSLASHLGFRNGDVIAEVGGNKIRGLEDVWKLLPIIAKESRVEVTVRRGGRIMTYYFDLK